MIKKFKSTITNDVIFYTLNTDGSYEYAWMSEASPRTYRKGQDTWTEQLKWMLQQGWFEVAAGLDPNDLQGTYDHRKWDAATDACAICGKDWSTILWAPSGKPCCGGNNGQGPYFYSGGTWHSSDCDSLKPPELPKPVMPKEMDYLSRPSYRCQCGAQATTNPNCHSAWCPEYKK